MTTYDLAIIGTGPAGAFALMRAAEEHSDKKILALELGRPPAKRRRQLEGWLGCLPTGDGKIYVDDHIKVPEDELKEEAKQYLYSKLQGIHNPKSVIPKVPSQNLLKRFSEFNIEYFPYQQWEPEDFHRLSKLIADKLEDSNNITLSFDNEVFSFMKNGDVFEITTQEGEFRAKRLLLATGRSGWRWLNAQFFKLGILKPDYEVEFGVRIEMSGQYLKDLNKSHCLFKNDKLTIGPFYWNGSLIQEDHADLTLASFRSNEARWKTEKVFFPIISKKTYDKDACWQKERLAKLAFILSGDRVGREKVRAFTKSENQLSLIPEYVWLKEMFEEVNVLIPNLINRGYFHVPELGSLASKFEINNYQTEIPGLFVAGEVAGISGIAAAAMSGIIALEKVFNE
jgi:uncharacterized FAD-dependent dehydrogenase